MKKFFELCAVCMFCLLVAGNCNAELDPYWTSVLEALSPDEIATNFDWVCEVPVDNLAALDDGKLAAVNVNKMSGEQLNGCTEKVVNGERLSDRIIRLHPGDSAVSGLFGAMKFAKENRTAGATVSTQSAS